jgi:hypothetical protein
LVFEVLVGMIVCGAINALLILPVVLGAYKTGKLLGWWDWSED